jgi:hypothetical protein
MSAEFERRDREYLELLHFGLVLLRNYSHSGRVDLCRVEADHLHELPTLVGEPNEGRHLHYLVATRPHYLDSLRRLGASDYLEQVGIWYAEPWRALTSVAGRQLENE